jgi:hypothetical protein
LTPAAPAGIVRRHVILILAMKTLLVWALLAFMPLSNLRMVCIYAESTGARPASGSVRAADAADDDACSRICKKRPAATPAASCFLIADPSCAFVAAAAVAVMPRESSFSIDRVAVPIQPGTVNRYIAPSLVRHSPPPKP